MTQGFRIEKLRRDHPVDGFTCGREALDRFLVRYAFINQQANASQTYLGLRDGEVIGFYSLVVGEVAYGNAPQRLTQGLAHHPVPIMLLARLAVSTAWQGRGIGAGLLKDAMRRTLQAADIGGIRFQFSSEGQPIAPTTAPRRPGEPQNPFSPLPFSSLFLSEVD